MKKILLFFVLCSQFINAAEVSSLEEARKLALATNKIIIVDFWATWCGPCKKMDMDTWSNDKVKLALDDFIFVKIDIDIERDVASKYDVKSIPNVFFLDGNGVAIYSFVGYKDANQIMKDLENHAISTEMISLEMINQYKSPSYINSLKLLYKYFDFTLYAEGDLKNDLLTACNSYLDDTKKYFSKKDENYEQKKQKMELLNLYDLAYGFNFKKLEKKIAEIKSESIYEMNKYDFWFLKYLSIKGVDGDLKDIEEQLKNNDLENIVSDSDKLLAFYKKMINVK